MRTQRTPVVLSQPVGAAKLFALRSIPPRSRAKLEKQGPSGCSVTKVCACNGLGLAVISVVTEITASMSYREHEPCGAVKPLEGSLAPLEGTRFPGFPETRDGDARIGGWIFYDADCALCAGSAKWTAGLLGRHGFALVPLQTPGTAERVGVTSAELLTRVHLLTRERRRFAGADAFVEIARHIGWARPLSFVAGSSLVLPRLRRIYDWIAANRYCFGGTCSVPRRRSTLDWLPLLILPAVALALRDFMADWVFMWAMAFALFAGCKWLTYRKAVTNGVAFSMGRTLGYLFGWVGMKADVFTLGKRPRIPTTVEWIHASGRILAGAALVWGAARMILPFAPLLSGWVAMFGIILLLHFGTFQLLALMWQRFGVAVEPLMRAPLQATSLGDFWGARWNTGFHAVAHEFLFRPLSRFLGSFDFQQRSRLGVLELRQKVGQASRLPRPRCDRSPLAPSAPDRRDARPTSRFAIMALPVLGVFLVSGLIHEIVITLPARGGYGLPTAYFLLQSLGLVLERSALSRRLGLGAGLRGRLFAIAVAAAPAFWLFPPVFVRNVILPMLEAIGAL